MRIALIVMLALAGCAKKQSAPPAATPAATPAPETESSETAPGGGDSAPDEVKGDPCDGGESKGK